jgi:hypothetical protein
MISLDSFVQGTSYAGSASTKTIRQRKQLRATLLGILAALFCINMMYVIMYLT